MKNSIFIKIGFAFLLFFALTACTENTSKKTNTENIHQKQKSKKPKKQKTIHPTIEDALNKNYPENELLCFRPDTAKSMITWFCVTHTGYMKFQSGEIGLYNKEIAKADFSIKMNSIVDTDIDYKLMKDVLTNTLKSAMFFDVKNYPYSYFNLTHLKKEKGSFYQAIGNLKIKGIIHPIQFRCSITQNDSSMMIISERFTIDRTLWGITIYSENYEQTDDSFLFTDMIDLQVSLYLMKE